MSTSDRRTRHLLGLLAKENSKTGTYQPTPSQFRDTLQDTHKTTPAEYFGPSPDLLPLGFQAPGDYLTQLKSHSARAGRRSQSAVRPGSGRGVVPADQLEFKSVFRPLADQEHVCGLARNHRGKVANSEWALIDNLEIKLFNDEKDQRARMKVMTAAEQKAYLDGQMREKQRQEEHAAIMRTREQEMVRLEAARHREEEAAKEAQLRARNVAMKNERMSMLQTAHQAKQAAMQAKQAEEAQMLADNQMRLDQERAAAAAKAEALKQQNELLRQQNSARIRARKEAEEKQKLKDEEMMQAGIRMAEKQEKDREEAMHSFHKMIEARTRGAGQQALNDKQARMEREDRLIKQFEEQKEREQKLREEQAQLRKDRQKKEVLQAREEFLVLKDQRAMASREEMVATKEALDAKARAEKEAEDRKMAGIRARARTNGDFQTTQITDKEMRTVDEYVGMTEAEKLLNYRLLKQATRVVGTIPKQMTAKW